MSTIDQQIDSLSEDARDGIMDLNGMNPGGDSYNEMYNLWREGREAAGEPYSEHDFNQDVLKRQRLGIFNMARPIVEQMFVRGVSYDKITNSKTLSRPLHRVYEVNSSMGPINISMPTHTGHKSLVTFFRANTSGSTITINYGGAFSSLLEQYASITLFSSSVGWVVLGEGSGGGGGGGGGITPEDVLGLEFYRSIPLSGYAEGDSMGESVAGRARINDELILPSHPTTNIEAHIECELSIPGGVGTVSLYDVSGSPSVLVGSQDISSTTTVSIPVPQPVSTGDDKSFEARCSMKSGPGVCIIMSSRLDIKSS